MYCNELVITLYVFSACYAVEIHFAIHIRYLKTFLLFFNALQIPRCFYSTRKVVIDILNNFLVLQYIKISSYWLNVFICLWPSFLLMYGTISTAFLLIHYPSESIHPTWFYWGTSHCRRQGCNGRSWSLVRGISATTGLTKVGLAHPSAAVFTDSWSGIRLSGKSPFAKPPTAVVKDYGCLLLPQQGNFRIPWGV